MCSLPPSALLLPFGLGREQRSFDTYWHTILPNSKRWLSQDTQLGSNADVRSPEATEIWRGGIMRWGGGQHQRLQYEPDTVTLKFDAVFFATGECVGPDTQQLWERVVYPAEVAGQIARAVRKRLQDGLSTGRILTAVEQITGTVSLGPIPPRPPAPGRADSHDLYELARQQIARQVAGMRTTLGENNTVSVLNTWADAQVPEFRRIQP